MSSLFLFFFLFFHSNFCWSPKWQDRNRWLKHFMEPNPSLVLRRNQKFSSGLRRQWERDSKNTISKCDFSWPSSCVSRSLNAFKPLKEYSAEQSLGSHTSFCFGKLDPRWAPPMPQCQILRSVCTQLKPILHPYHLQSMRGYHHLGLLVYLEKTRCTTSFHLCLMLLWFRLLRLWPVLLACSLKPSLILHPYQARQMSAYFRVMRFVSSHKVQCRQLLKLIAISRAKLMPKSQVFEGIVPMDSAALSLFPSIAWKRCRKLVFINCFDIALPQRINRWIQQITPHPGRQPSYGVLVHVETRSVVHHIFKRSYCSQSRSQSTPLYTFVFTLLVAINCVKGQLKNWKHGTKEHPWVHLERTRANVPFGVVRVIRLAPTWVGNWIRSRPVPARTIKRLFCASNWRYLAKVYRTVATKPSTRSVSVASSRILVWTIALQRRSRSSLRKLPILTLWRVWTIALPTTIDHLHHLPPQFWGYLSAPARPKCCVSWSACSWSSTNEITHLNHSVFFFEKNDQMSKELIEFHVFKGRLPIGLAVSGPTQQAVHWHKPLVLHCFADFPLPPSPATTMAYILSAWTDSMLNPLWNGLVSTKLTLASIIPPSSNPLSWRSFSSLSWSHPRS